MRVLGEVWRYVADSSCRGYSPLYDRICRVVATSDAVLDLVERAPAEAHNPVLLLAAVHHLVLGGAPHELARAYAGESAADPGELFVDFCLTHEAELLELLRTRQVNTNEVGRSAVIGPALTTVGARFGAPLALVDVGCSAGLNLLPDRYRLDYGAAGATGPAHAAVRIACRVVGGEPPIAAHLPAIAARVGLDRAPVDLRSDDAARWQLACVWPDTGRLDRTRAAIEAARGVDLRLVQGDAIADVAGVLAGLPDDSIATVTTTWVLGYLPPEGRLAFRDALAAASRSRPVAWVSAEGHGVVEGIPTGPPPAGDDGVEACVLGLTIFAGGDAADELLGYVHPHGSTLDWRA